MHNLSIMKYKDLGRFWFRLYKDAGTLATECSPTKVWKALKSIKVRFWPYPWHVTCVFLDIGTMTIESVPHPSKTTAFWCIMAIYVSSEFTVCLTFFIQNVQIYEYDWLMVTLTRCLIKYIPLCDWVAVKCFWFWSIRESVPSVTQYNDSGSIVYCSTYRCYSCMWNEG